MAARPRAVVREHLPSRGGRRRPVRLKIDQRYRTPTSILRGRPRGLQWPHVFAWDFWTRAPGLQPGAGRGAPTDLTESTYPRRFEYPPEIVRAFDDRACWSTSLRPAAPIERESGCDYREGGVDTGAVRSTEPCLAFKLLCDAGDHVRFAPSYHVVRSSGLESSRWANTAGLGHAAGPLIWTRSPPPFRTHARRGAGQSQTTPPAPT